ncbi:hypothetical protein QBC40DRAFT_291522 [Triangularia verruculosa]|uniref:Uncharacterized protein n=1 Tax=Triangularia verruculosa TaxID=2587418 RepID=A0AAN6X4R3_9PEZI|nr:hypothetical protein QBC40DRAFT_291522 [Triangularia verruculosa]
MSGRWCGVLRVWIGPSLASSMGLGFGAGPPLLDVLIRPCRSSRTSFLASPIFSPLACLRRWSEPALDCLY